MSETKPFAELEVPGEPGVYWCAKHNKVQTRLRCGRCEKPICPKCTRMGPTGARCNDCFTNRGSHMYQVAPWQFAAAFGVAVVAGLIGGFLTQAILLLVFFAPVVGPFLGKVITTVTRGKRGTHLAIVTSAGLVVGALIPIALKISATRSLLANYNPNYTDPSAIISAAGLDVAAGVLFLILAIPAMWWWLK